MLVTVVSSYIELILMWYIFLSPAVLPIPAVVVPIAIDRNFAVNLE